MVLNLNLILTLYFNNNIIWNSCEQWTSINNEPIYLVNKKK